MIALRPLWLALAFWLGTRPSGAQTGANTWGPLVVRPDGRVALEIHGDLPSLFRKYDALYPLDASSNLIDWAPLPLLVRTSLVAQSVEYVDADAVGLPRRFYRSAVSPYPTALRKPTGPYAVGRTTRLVADPARQDRVGAATNGAFLITVWYPAWPGSGFVPAPYIDPGLASPLAVSHLDAPADNSTRLRALTTFSRVDAPAATADHPFPVVIYSHGYSFHRQENAEKFEDLASHGIVTVAMDHADSRASVFADGTVVRGIFGDPPLPAQTAAAVESRLKDDLSVLSFLAEMNNHDPLLAGRLDLERLGAMGWSLGNSDLGRLVLREPRFKCFVVLEGYLQAAEDVLSALVDTGFRVPVLGLYVEDFDGTALWHQATQVATHDAYYARVRLSSHYAFKDTTEETFATAATRQGTAALRACVSSFFRKYLQGQDDHLLDDPQPTYPEILEYVRK